MANGQIWTNFARAKVTSLLSALTLYLGVGTGTTTPVNSGTALTTEVTTAALGGSATYSRASTTLTQQTTNAANDTLQAQGTYTVPGTAANTISVTEAGTFDAATAGNMYFWTVFSVINLAPSFSLQATLSTVFA